VQITSRDDDGGGGGGDVRRLSQKIVSFEEKYSSRSSPVRAAKTKRFCKEEFVDLQQQQQQQQHFAKASGNVNRVCVRFRDALRRERLRRRPGRGGVETIFDRVLEL